MKNSHLLKSGLAILLIFLFHSSFAQRENQEKIDTSRIRIAAELIGLDFDQKELELTLQAWEYKVLTK